jgi:exodeoxyribonuclease V beta subunit
MNMTLEHDVQPVNVSSWHYPCPNILADMPLEGHVRIEASAGTGKTYTLEHLVVDRLVRTSASLGEILVMTFTEKATAELKQRIRKLLTDVILKAEHTKSFETNTGAHLYLNDDHQLMWCFDQETRRKLELTLFGFDEAPIFTIHGFCSRILREQAFFLGEPLLQERVDTKTLFREIWRDYLSSADAQKSDAQQVLTAWLDAKKETGLFSLLYDAFNAKYARYAFEPNSNAQIQISRLKASDGLDALEQSVEHAAIRNEARSELIRESRSLFNLLQEIAEAPQSLERLNEINWKAVVSPHRTRVGTGKFKFPDGLTEPAASWHQAAKSLHVMWQVMTSEAFEVLDFLLPKLAGHMTARKRRDFLFDYDDLLHRLHQVLVIENNTALASELRAQYRYALVDEFQDTDEIQWQIIEQIFLATAGSQLILIGDPKQSIYGFRGAEIETYLRAGIRLEERVGEAPTDIYLDTNFRSSNSLLDGLNLILLQSDEQPFFSGRTSYNTPVKCGKPQLCIHNQDGQVVPAISLVPFRPPSRGNKLAAGDLLGHYAQRVTVEIIHLLSASPFTIVGNTPDEGRQVEPSDILILVRKNSEAREIESVLRAANLPVAQAPSGSVFKSNEALAVLDLLKAIASPAQTAAWTRVLAGPFFGLNWVDISALGQQRPAALQVRLEQWHELSKKGRIEQVLSEAYELTNLELRSALFDQDDQELLNLRAVLNYTAVEAQRRHLRIHQLITWFEDIMADIEAAPDPYADAPPAPENSNSIRIMTMHASKGLESPVVFLCGGFSSLKKPLIYRSSAMGAKSVFLSAHLPEAVLADVTESEREEDEKLLYVGLTRASVKLYLPFIESEASIKGMYEYLNQRLKRLMTDDRLSASSFIVEPTKRHSAEHWTHQTDLEALPEEKTILQTLVQMPKEWSEAQTPITSYSKLKQHQKLTQETDQMAQFLSTEQSQPTLLDPEFTDPDLMMGESEVSETLVGGKEMGQVLHDCLEHIDGLVWMDRDKTEFLASPEVVCVASTAINKHRIDQDALPSVLTLIWDVLNAKLKLTDEIHLPALGSLPMLKEMEFLYPAPSNHDSPEGYIRGFIDGLFQFEGRYYWLDWKSDRLPDYSPQSLQSHVQSHYGIQAQLYTLALERLLRIENKTQYDALMGGLIYVYLRGVNPEDTGSNAGVFFSHPTYEDTRHFEQEWSVRGLYSPPTFNLPPDGKA